MGIPFSFLFAPYTIPPDRHRLSVLRKREIFSDGRVLTVCVCKNGGMNSMERTKTQFSRLLELDQRIRRRGYPNCLTFAEEWEVSQKTVQRDIDYLRDMLVAPIEYDRDRKGFYYINQNWFLPSLSMSEGDLLAVLRSEEHTSE